MQAVLGGGHQAFQQRSVQAVQILNCIRYSEAGTQVEMKLGMAHQRKIHQNNISVGLL